VVVTLAFRSAAWCWLGVRRGKLVPPPQWLGCLCLTICLVLLLQIPGVLSLIDDITLGPYSIMDADHMDPHIAGTS
jgi:hypothetical protein